jgi:hypothetical protein
MDIGWILFGDRIEAGWRQVRDKMGKVGDKFEIG